MPLIQDGRRRRLSIRAITFYFILGQVHGVKGKVTLVTTYTIGKYAILSGEWKYDGCDWARRELAHHAFNIYYKTRVSPIPKG